MCYSFPQTIVFKGLGTVTQLCYRNSRPFKNKTLRPVMRSPNFPRISQFTAKCPGSRPLSGLSAAPADKVRRCKAPRGGSAAQSARPDAVRCKAPGADAPIRKGNKKGHRESPGALDRPTVHLPIFKPRFCISANTIFSNSSSDIRPMIFDGSIIVICFVSRSLTSISTSSSANHFAGSRRARLF